VNSEKLIALAKQWSNLQKEQRDLDFRKAEWARKARGCFQDDRRFIAWCKSDLAISDAAAQDLCLRARAAGIVPDAKTWTKLGGFGQIRAVESLPKREQVHVLEAAKSTGRAVRSLVRERHPEMFENATRTPEITRRQMTDIELLSQFIAKHIDALPRLPSDVEVIVRMYVPGVGRKRAA